MAYKRREQTPPTDDEIAAVKYVRDRARSFGLVLSMTDSHLRKMLYRFIERRMKCGVYYQTVLEAAESYWRQDERYFKVFALIYKICEAKINESNTVSV